MYVLAGLVERLSRERHPVFPADEPTNPSGSSLDRADAGCVTLPPHHPLGEGRHQFAMMIAQRAIRTIREQGIEEGTACMVLAHTFGNTDDERDTTIGGNLCECRARRPTYIDAVGGHASEHRLRRCVIPDPDIPTAIEPSGIAGEPRFRKDDELRTIACRLLCARASQRESFIKCRSDFVLNDRNADVWWCVRRHRSVICGTNVSAKKQRSTAWRRADAR